MSENAHGDIAGFEMRSDRQPIRAGTDHGDLTITPWRCCVHGKLMRLREGSEGPALVEATAAVLGAINEGAK